MNISRFLEKNKSKIILSLNLILISSLSFMAGCFYIDQQDNHHEIEFENAEDICSDFFVKDTDKNNVEELVQDSQNKNNSPQSRVGESVLGNSDVAKKNISEEKEKMFVGSKNSNIYHKPDCPYAKKILDKNKIWFSSKEDAESRGYRMGKCCNP